MGTIYLSAVRRMLPRAQIAVDLIHVVHLANNTAADVRRRAIRCKYGRRCRSVDPSTESRTCSPSNLEDLTGGQFAKIIGTLDTDTGGQLGGPDALRGADREKQRRRRELQPSGEARSAPSITPSMHHDQDPNQPVTGWNHKPGSLNLFHPPFASRICNTWMALASCPARQRAAAELAEDVPGLELGVRALAG